MSKSIDTAELVQEAESKPGLLVVGPYAEPEMEALGRSFAVHRLWEAADTSTFLRQVGPSIRAIGTRGELGAKAELIEALPALEIIACFGVGTDAIDLAAARARGIHVTNTPDVLTEDVADMGFALLLATARRIPAGDAYVRGGTWAQANMALTTRFWGKRLGIVGLGRIGRAVARRAKGFGLSIAYTDQSSLAAEPFDFYPDVASLAGAVDFLIVCAAGGEGTRGLIDARVLAALGPQGILVNIARGSLVDEAALLSALWEGRLGAAGLDVFQNEPHIDPGFAALPNVVLQPHHASGTVETRAAMGDLVRANLEAHFAGRPLLTPVA
jgi:lactate dehydrogenase-like 2-hydroxyacid dehydrogenase